MTKPEMTGDDHALGPVKERAITPLKPYAGDTRRHSKPRIRQIAGSIERFGFTNPVLISDDDTVAAGHGRLAAAKLLGCSRHGDNVLDTFAGYGTTLMAADQVERKARVTELDPAYCDTVIRRWRDLAGKDTVLAATGEAFEDTAKNRLLEETPA